MLTTKKTLKSFPWSSSSLDLCEGTIGDQWFPTQRASNAESVSISCRLPVRIKLLFRSGQPRLSPTNDCWLSPFSFQVPYDLSWSGICLFKACVWLILIGLRLAAIKPVITRSLYRSRGPFEGGVQSKRDYVVARKATSGTDFLQKEPDPSFTER